MQLRTRVLSLVLAGSMTLSVLPVSAFAESAEQPTAPAVLAGTSENVSASTLAIDNYGYPYLATNGDESAIDHSKITAKDPNGTWEYRTFGSSSNPSYILDLSYRFTQDLSGQTINCQVFTRAEGLHDVTFNGTVQVYEDMSNCTFNGSVMMGDKGGNNGVIPPTILTDCTLNSGLTCTAQDGRLVNCSSNGIAGIACQHYGSTVPYKLTINNDDAHTIEGGLFAREHGSIEINGGKFTGGFYMQGAADDCTINGGTFGCTVSVQDGTLTINDGTFNNNRSVVATSYNGTVGTIVINDGTFTSFVSAEGDGILTINDGVFKAVGSRGNGTVNANGGIFESVPDGENVHMLMVLVENSDAVTINGLSKNSIYIANKTTAPHIDLTYDPNGRTITAWYVQMGIGENVPWGYTDADGSDVKNVLQAAGYKANDTLTQLSFNCISVMQDYVFLLPVYAVETSDLTFTKSDDEGHASVTPGDKMPSNVQLTQKYYKVENGTVTSEALDEYPTEPGTYQIAVQPAFEKTAPINYKNRFVWQGSYYELDTSKEMTSTAWRFTVLNTSGGDEKPIIDESTGVPSNKPEEDSGWTYSKEDNTLTLEPNRELDLSDSPAVKCNVTNEGVITGGTYAGKVENTGNGTIEGGVFLQEPNTTVQTVKVTATGGVSLNGLTNETNGDTTVHVVNGNTAQDLTVSYEVPTGRDFHAWMSSGSVDGKEHSVLAFADSTFTISVDKSIYRDSTLTPVVEMNTSDLDIDKEKELAADTIVVDLPGVKVAALRYYKVGDAEDAGLETLPEESGTYAVYAVLDMNAAENSIAAYAADDAAMDTEGTKRVVVKGGVGYYVPTELDTGVTVTVGDGGNTDSGNTDTGSTGSSSGDSGAGVALAVGGAAVVGTAVYYFGTTAYLKSTLPEGTAIPTTRAQLAELLWTNAGKPEPKAVLTDATDTTKAITWCVENALLKDAGKPESHVTRVQVIQSWNALQELTKAR